MTFLQAVRLCALAQGSESTVSTYDEILLSLKRTRKSHHLQQYGWTWRTLLLLLLLLSYFSRVRLCDPIDGSPPGSPIHGIFQARLLEWGAIAFSNVWKWKVKGKSLSLVCFLATPWTAAYQAPPSMEFSRQEYWSGVPLPSPYTHYYV